MNEDQLLADCLSFGNVTEVLESPGKLSDIRESQSMGKKGESQGEPLRVASEEMCGAGALALGTLLAFVPHTSVLK